MMKPGDTGHWVEVLQKRLNRLPGYHLTVNGVYDAATEAAVKHFQGAHGYDQTGNASRFLSIAIRMAVWRHEHPVGGSPPPDPPTPGPFVTVKGCDYAWQTLDTHSLEHAGVEFVMRYLSHDASKNLSGGELAQLRKAGMQVGLVWETTANRALSGHTGGAADAKDVLLMLGKLGVGAQAVAFAVDFDASQAQLAIVADYFAGVATVLPASRVGVYGGFGVVRRVLASGHAKHAWQTYAWSGGQWDPRAALRQVKNGVHVGSMVVDLCEQHAETDLLF